MRPQLILALLGLLCVAASILIAFQQPFGLWHWALLLVALACLAASRRLHGP